MNPNQLKQLEKLAKVFNTDNVITPEDIAQVVKGIAQIIKVERENVKNLSQEHRELLQAVINTVSEEHDKVLAQVKNTSQNAISETTEAINKLTLGIEEVKRIAKEVMEMKPENGLDADEDLIVEKVLAEIKLPEYKETVLDDGEQIRDKLTSLEGDKRLDISAIKGTDKLTTQANLDRAISILDQRTQFLVNKVNNAAGATAFTSLTDVPSSYTGAGGKVVAVNVGETGLEFISASGVGTVTSVAATVPTGLTISGSPITAAGTLAIGLDTGYVIPLQSTIDAKAPLTAPTFATSITASYATLSTVPYFDASKNLVSSAVTPTELGYLSGVTSAIQTQINAKGAGTVTSVGWTGGIVSIATATTTPAFTIAGTSGGIPYFSSSSTWATSATLAANALVVGGGAGVAPSTVTTGANVLTALAVNVGSAGAFVTFNGALGTPSSGTVTNLTGTASININGTVGATTPAAGTFTTATTTGNIELGHASDTTISRVSAGVIAVEGVTVATASNTLTLSNKSVSGALTLEENSSIALDPAASADGKYTGITRTGTAGAALAFGDLCYLDPTDSRWELADANAAQGADGDARGVLGICVLAAAADGDPTTMLLYGTVRADTAFPTMTVNNQMYVSETAGDITGTQPTTTDVVIRVVGVALSADELLFNPSPDYITHT